MRERFQAGMREAGELLRAFREDPVALDSMVDAAVIIVQCFATRGRVLACGNGGSMADAMHFAEEFSGRFREDRPPLPAIALSDPAHITCVANDYGFEHVFARQVEALGHEGDALVVLSTSGDSANVLKAIQAAKARKMRVIGLLGRGGGKATALCDVAILAPGETSDRIQELHMMALHLIIEEVEAELASK
jgi:D-sedoheptulose 7-phosphate isomerase